jgi:hypothetical protein
MKVNQGGCQRSGKIINAISSPLPQQSRNSARLLCLNKGLYMGYTPLFFILHVLKHPRLADFVVSLRQRFRKAKSYDVASSITLIHFQQTKRFLNLMVIYHTFCHRAHEQLSWFSFILCGQYTEMTLFFLWEQSGQNGRTGRESDVPFRTPGCFQRDTEGFSPKIHLFRPFDDDDSLSQKFFPS